MRNGPDPFVLTCFIIVAIINLLTIALHFGWI